MLVKKGTYSVKATLNNNFYLGKQSRHLLICILALSGILGHIGAEVSSEFVGTPWEDKIGANTNRTVRLANNTSKKLDVKGVRFSVPENTAMKTGVMDGSSKLKVDDPWHSDRRYEARLKYPIGAGATSGAIIKGGGATTKIDWSPYDPQVLVKTRSFADMGDFIDANPVTVDQIDSIIGEDAFYDENLYECDTLGVNGPLFGAGFIDTYIKQSDSTPITQVQMNEFAEDTYIRASIGYFVKYRPDLMGENDNVPGKNNGAGPLYSMGLVAAQELMHIDQQFLAPMGIIETHTGFDCYGVMGSGNTATPGARVGITHKQVNSVDGMGPMHMEPSGFAEKAYASYPTFFPYASGGNPSQWFTTPGTESGGNALGLCTGNSSQIVNATMLATLYCWRGYEQLFRATDFYAKGIFEEAKDRKLAAKLYMWGWNAGFSSEKGGTYSGPLYWNDIKDIEDITPRISGSTNYVPKVMPIVDGIIEAQTKSELNGGTSKVIDIPISLEYIAEFFYGNDNAPYTSSAFAEQGKLGKGGILQHFPLTQDERKQLWSDLKTAFNKMKGKAPSNYGNAVSFRYDWLTLLRIAKGYIYPEMFDVPFKPVMLPTPTDIKFTNWINLHSTENNIPDIPEKDTTFPNLLVNDLDVSADGDFLIELRGGDNIALDIDDPLTAEYSIDPDWLRWMPGEYKSGDKKDAYFTLTIPADTIAAKFGDKDGKGWVRITDKSGNSTIDTITIGGVPYPKVDSVFMLDNAGDGIGNLIDVHMTKGGSDNADELSDWEEISYSWPDQLSDKLATDGQVTVSGSVLTITDDTYSDGAGLGLLTLSYPSKKNYGGDIEDRVGPALTKKANLFPAADPAKPDTLAITFSEAVEGLSDTKLQLAFSTDKSDSVTTQQVAVETFGDDSARYHFDAGALTTGNYKWVKMEISGGIIDKAPNKNVPLDKNQWVPILDNRAKYPTLDSAWTFDSDGNGTADSVAIHLTKSESVDAYELDAYKELDYSWPTKTSLEAAGTTVSDGNRLTFGDMTNSDGAGLGLLSILYDDMPGAAETDILDRVGPVITSATLSIEDAGRDKDTLLITTSEELDKYGDEGLNYTFLTKGSDETKEKSSILRVNATTYKVIYERDMVIDKDSVKFTTETELSDRVENTPMSINQRVLITKIGGKDPEINRAAIYDITGNGEGDSVFVELTLGSAVDKYTTADLLDGSYSFPGSDMNKSLNTDDMESASDESFGFYYKSEASSGIGQIRLNFPEDFSPEQVIDDRVGPVITSATLSIVDDSRAKDTLLITTSEELDNYSDEGLNYTFLTKGSSESKEKSTIERVNDTTYRVIYDRDLVIDKDSVNFTTETDLSDAVDNKPMTINQRVKITILGGKEPQINTAAVYDITGDGRGDSLFVALTLGAAPDKFTTSDLIDGTYSWPGSLMDKLLHDDDMESATETSFGIYYDTRAGSGTGRIRLNFPEDFSPERQIDDRVGPAIDKATCFQINPDRESDTLVLEVSETLKENFVDDSKYIILFEQESDSEGDTIPVEKMSAKDGNYVLVLAKSAVTYGDWVQFVYDSGIEDEVGNRPLPFNRKIEINVLGGVTPNITTANMYDVKGDHDRLDGHGDSLFVSLTLSDDPKALTVDSITSVEYTWGGATKSKNVDELIRLSETEFAIVDESLIGGSGTGTVTLSFEDENYSVSDDIEDKVAPVLKSASYYNWSDAKDTLHVEFSEELSETGSDTPLFKSGNTELTLREQNHDGAKVTYSVEGSREIKLGDSLWIKGAEEIIDTEDNEQQSNENIRIPLSYKRVVLLTDAAFRDSDSRPDGYIDEITLTFNADLNEKAEALIERALTLPEERKLTLNEVIIDDDEAKLYVTQNSDLVAANTAVTDSDLLSLDYAEGEDTVAILSRGELAITDKMAPVVLSARFTPAKSAVDGELRDELQVTYSEKVQKISTDEPFRFSDASKNNDEYSMDLSGDKSGRENVTYISIYNKANVLPGAGDSIWIEENGEIEDEAGRVQSRNTVPVPLTVDKYDRDYQIAVTPTPYDIKNYDDDSLAAIRILPRTRVLPDNITAQAVIYDKVGNVVKKVSKEEFGQVEDGALTFEFLPKNRNGRRLGEGCYAVQLFIETDDAESREERSYLFIKGIQPGSSEEKEEDEDKEEE